jgi:DNA-binding NarL/FixJ family response regulator
MKAASHRPPADRRGLADGEPAVQTILPLHWSGGRKAVGIVDDHPMTRAGIVQLLNVQTDLYVAFEAASPREAMAAIAEHGADLVLTDLTMEGRSGLEFIKDLGALHPQLPVLVLSMHDEQVYAERVLRSGARGYVMKSAGGEELLAAIRHVLEGEVHVSRVMTTRLLRTLSSSPVPGNPVPIARLTDREFQVLQLLGQGKSTRQIAAQLRISPKTVDVHRSRMRDKLELPDPTALMRFAVRWFESNAR